MKVTKQPDGKFKAETSEPGVEPILAETESRAVLEMKEAIQRKQTADESKAPFRIIR